MSAPLTASADAPSATGYLPPATSFWRRALRHRSFVLGGVLALIYRFRRVQLEQELAQVQAQVFAIRRLANAFLNIRDLMNSPLQVIELSVDALRKSDESQKPILDRIDRSVQNLREINSVLVEHEKEIEWQAKQ